MARGFTCPQCQSDQVGVIQTMPCEDAIHRRRVCHTCSQTFHTYEVSADLISTDPKFDFLFRKALGDVAD